MLAQLLVVVAASGAPATATAPSEPISPYARSAALDETALSQSTAREDLLQVNNSKQTAAVSDSSVAGDVRTGNTTFSDNAFQNVSGLTVINANTGNNVAINGSIVVNVSISPGP